MKRLDASLALTLPPRTAATVSKLGQRRSTGQSARTARGRIAISANNEAQRIRAANARRQPRA